MVTDKFCPFLFAICNKKHQFHAGMILTSQASIGSLLVKQRVQMGRILKKTQDYNHKLQEKERWENKVITGG